jgi:hypothetical protein
MRIHIVCQLAVTMVLTSVLCLGSVVSPSVANATVYYVATNGNDANPGIKSQPFQTLQKGVSVLRAGDTLYIRGGTYTEGDTSYGTLSQGGGVIIPSGTSWAAPVTIAGYPGETVSLPNSLNTQDNVNGSVVQYVVFENLTIPSYRVAGNTHHVRLSNSNIGGGQTPGNGSNVIMIMETTDFIELVHCLVHDALAGQPEYGYTSGQYGIYAKGDHMLIEGNTFYNNSGYAIHLYSYGHSVDNAIIRNNIMYNNAFDDGQRNLTLGVVMISGSKNLFYNNVLYNNLTSHGGPAVSVANGTNNQIYNNTIYGTSGAAIEVNASAPNSIIKNNILYNNGGGIVDWGATGTIQSNNLTTNPQFVNASANDFSLQAGSPAIDAGVTVSVVTTDMKEVSRPQGTTYDIGAYEYGKSPTLLSAPSNFRFASQ